MLPSSLGWRLPAVAGLGGDLAYATASKHGTLSILAAISSLYPITTITLGLLLKGTRPARNRGPAQCQELRPIADRAFRAIIALSGS
jgi:drug/metabolite transporter (DMT)-like permease